MDRTDRIRLQEMLAAAQEAVAIVGERLGAELAAERLRFLATIRLIEVVGEAAATLSADFRAAHADVPWREMIDPRNRLIHGYYDVDADIVAQVVRINLPSLVAGLTEIVTDEPGI